MKNSFIIFVLIITTSVIVSAFFIGYQYTESYNAATSPVPTIEVNKKMSETCSIWDYKTRFYYNQLPDRNKRVYRKILKELKNGNNEITFDELGKDAFYMIHTSVARDHPELFNISHFTWSSTGKSINKVTYPYYTKNCKDTIRQIDEIANSIIMKMPDGSEYDKVKYIYEYIIKHTDYETNSQYNQDVRSVFLNNRSVCSGYAKAFQYLCLKAGIDCAYVEGTVRSGAKHAWNLVKINNEYYWVDPTWGDHVFTNKISETEYINYDYLCVNNERLFKTHQLDQGLNFTNYKNKIIFKYPNCNDDSLYYYKLEGSYIDKYNKTKVENHISKYIKSGNYKNIPLKFSSKNDTQKAINMLFAKSNGQPGHIFELVKNNTKTCCRISYKYTYYKSSNYIILSLDIN